MDSDEDGTLGRDEFVKTVEEIFGKDMAEKLFARLDGDRDGRLSKEEIEADLENGEGVCAEIFRTLFDGNGDGKVTQGEFRIGTAGRVDDARHPLLQQHGPDRRRRAEPARDALGLRPHARRRRQNLALPAGPAAPGPDGLKTLRAQMPA